MQSGTGKLDGNLQPIGYVDATQVATVVDPAGTRVYSLDPAATLRTWNVAQPASGGSIGEVTCSTCGPRSSR